MVLSTDGPTEKSWLGHMNHGYGRRGRTASTTSTPYYPLNALRPVLRGFRIQSRDQWLGCWGYCDTFGQNNIPRGNLLAVHTAVVAIVRTDCRAFEREAGKQAASPG